MSETLFDEVANELGDQSIDAAAARERFLDVGREYVAQAEDPTTEQVQALVDHFEDRDPEDIGDESLALLWTMCSVFRWMLDGLPLQGQTRDPEWLRKKRDLWGGIMGESDGR